MHIETTGTARIRHKTTGDIFEIDADELDWDSVSGDEEQMGARTQWAADIEHDELGSLSWTVWEYPPGHQDHAERDVNGHVVIEDFNITLQHDPHPSDTDDDEDLSEAVEWADIPEAEQVETMTAWFNQNFEDPQNEMPYGDAETDDNYTYIWGGPYDASEEIRNEFEGMATEGAILAAIEEVQSDGTFDWAPTSDHPERRRLESGSYDLDDDDGAEPAANDGQSDVDIDEIVIPHQLQAPLQTFERNDHVAMEPPTIFVSRTTRFRTSGHAAILEALDDFAVSFPAHNHPSLGLALNRLRSGLGADVDSMDVVRVGTATERINQYAIRADEMFLPDMAAEVSALNASLSTNLAHFDEWAQYKNGLRGDPEVSDTSLKFAQAVLTELVKSDVLEQPVREELETEIIPFTMPLEGEVGTEIERKSFFRSLSNVLSTTTSMAVRYCKVLGKNLGEGHLETFKDIGKAATVTFFIGGANYLTALATGHPLFAFLVPALKFILEAAVK